MENGRDQREEYEDQDAEPTMMAPPGQRPSDTGLRDERSTVAWFAAELRHTRP